MTLKHQQAKGLTLTLNGEASLVHRRHLMQCRRSAVRTAWRRFLICLAAGVIGPASAANPYQGICERNAFHLRPPPPAFREISRGPLPRIHLTGITTILRGKRALLKVEFPAKPPERAKEECYILTEGQRVGPIEVIEINEKRDQVKVDEAGTITNLTFEKIVPAQVPLKPQPLPRWRGVSYRAASR